MSDLFILDGKTPVRCYDILRWADWRSKTNKKIKLNKVGKSTISTIFLGIDHNIIPGGLPVLFETYVFDGPLDGEMERFFTWDDAVKGHDKMVEKVKAASKL